MSDNKLKIGITQGDTNGIGWEVILKTFADSRMPEVCVPVVYGSEKAADYYRRTIADAEIPSFNICRSAEEARRGRLNLVPCGDSELRIETGHRTEAAGKAAVEALLKAAAELADGKIDAIVTAPIEKSTAQCDDFRFTGHTEFFGDRFGGEPLMLMCSDRLRVGLVTIHRPVTEISKNITVEKIASRLQQMRQTLKSDFGVVEPRIAVLALNPHCGDNGLTGTEEAEVIKPAIERACADKVLAFGPFAADGFFASEAFLKYDAVLAMYHDQGLAPFKVISPDGVNFTAGLSVVRTSPDHGVGYDIAGKDKADPASMRNAVFMAVDIVKKRRSWSEWTSNPLPRFERDKGRDVSVKDLKLPEQED